MANYRYFMYFTLAFCGMAKQSHLRGVWFKSHPKRVAKQFKTYRH